MNDILAPGDRIHHPTSGITAVLLKVGRIISIARPANQNAEGYPRTFTLDTASIGRTWQVIDHRHNPDGVHESVAPTQGPSTTHP